MNSRFGGTVYWLITFVTGLIITISPKILGGKFKTTEDDHVILGSILLTISSIFLLYKTIKWLKSPDEGKEK